MQSELPYSPGFIAMLDTLYALSLVEIRKVVLETSVAYHNALLTSSVQEAELVRSRTLRTTLESLGFGAV